MKIFVLLLFSASLVSLPAPTKSERCNSAPSPDAKPNQNNLTIAVPSFVKKTTNGELYTVGEGQEMMWLVHLWGGAYEMGQAMGELLRPQIQQFIDEVWVYLETEIEDVLSEFLPNLPEWAQKMIADIGLDATLDLTYDLTKDYTPSYWFDELKGIANGSTVDYLKVRRLHMLPELTQAACSMFGAWGSAVSQSNTDMLQLRAFDWISDGPFQDFPMISIYHPSEAFGGHAYANLAFTGMAGTVSGMSSAQLAISEIGVSCPDDTWGEDSRTGYNWFCLLRDILQFDVVLDDAINRIANAKRTCNMLLGVGSGSEKAFRGFQYSSTVCSVFDDKNLRPDNDTWHPKIEDVVYWGMDWANPGISSALATQLIKYHGSLSAEITVKYIPALVQTGDVQVAVYDLTNMKCYVSYARGSNETGPDAAYDRPFVGLDMQELFAHKPSSTD